VQQLIGGGGGARAYVNESFKNFAGTAMLRATIYIIIIYTVYYYELYLLSLDEHIYTHYTLYNNIIIQTTTEAAAAAAVAQSIIQILATVLFSFYFLRLPQQNRNVRSRVQYIYIFIYNVYYILLRPCCRRIR